MSNDPQTCGELLNSQVGLIENLNSTLLLKARIVIIAIFLLMELYIYWIEKSNLEEKHYKLFRKTILTMHVLMGFIIAYLFVFIK